MLIIKHTRTVQGHTAAHMSQHALRVGYTALYCVKVQLHRQGTVHLPSTPRLELAAGHLVLLHTQQSHGGFAQCR
jgi:hypothetical protein